jgi:hypothetical protein
MIIKDFLRKLEIPVVIFLVSTWFIIYVSSRIFLEMYTDHSPRYLWLWLMLIFSPFCIYAALRTVFSKGEKWYGFIGYLLIYMVCSAFFSNYMLVNGDILLTMAGHSERTIDVPVVEVRKVFRRKLGFDHTEVTVRIDGRPVIFEARPYAYFFLHDKKVLRVSFGHSGLGNSFVTDIKTAPGEKIHARWLHIQDWAYRQRYIVGFFLGVFVLVLIRMKYFPEMGRTKPVKIGFWKLMAIVFGTVMLIGLLLYAALWIYIGFFASRHHL